MNLSFNKKCRSTNKSITNRLLDVSCLQFSLLSSKQLSLIFYDFYRYINQHKILSISKHEPITSNTNSNTVNTILNLLLPLPWCNFTTNKYHSHESYLLSFNSLHKLDHQSITTYQTSYTYQSLSYQPIATLW